MNNKIILTNDGSTTLFSNIFQEHYHSIFGALQESEHIFINAGLKKVLNVKSHLNILEIGFGTGLNLLLTEKAVRNRNVTIHYEGVEPFPPSIAELSQLNYPELLNFDKIEYLNIFNKREGVLSKKINYKIVTNKIQDTIFHENNYHLIYFDAFSPEIQPEMWVHNVFNMIFKSMSKGGILVTYSCKGNVKRILKAVGFYLEKLSGPPGKREFLRATKF